MWKLRDKESFLSIEEEFNLIFNLLLEDKSKYFPSIVVANDGGSGEEFETIFTI